MSTTATITTRATTRATGIATTSPIPYFTLHTGRKIPAMALGTWKSPNEEVASAVFHAIKDGYRHIDTASHYENEEGVGAGIKRAIEELGVKRSELFVTTKIWLDDFHNVSNALDVSLQKLFPGDKDPYLDLYLMHWPISLNADKTLDTSISFNEVWAELEKLPESKARDIGISNFTIANVKRLLSTAKKTPVVNQVELHPTLPQPRLVKFLLSGDYGFPLHDGKIIYPEAYCPLSRGNHDNPEIAKIAEKYGVSTANVVLSWGILRRTIVLPKSVTPSRIAENLKFVDLSKRDFDKVTEIVNKNPVHRHCSLAVADVFNDNEDSK